jgi:hypothetical protein
MCAISSKDVNLNVIIKELFYNTVPCDSNIYLYECPYMFRSSYDRFQKAQPQDEETTVT